MSHEELETQVKRQQEQIDKLGTSMIELTLEQVEGLLSLVGDHLKLCRNEYDIAYENNADFLTAYWAEQVKKIEALIQALTVQSLDDAL